MAGTLNLFDSVQITADSEYRSREGVAIDTLQIHHATTPSLSGLISLMQPGGRTVSANMALSNTGHGVEVVPLWKRAFTSASAYDKRSLTVEACNTTLAPNWGISQATHDRLVKLAVDMMRNKLLGGINRKFIIGHWEVPGTYPTSCPGPSMQLNWIASTAGFVYLNGTTKQERTEMKLILHRVGPDMAYYVVSETNVIGPLVMSNERLKGVQAVFGPAAEVWGDGLSGLLDVTNENRNRNADAYKG